MRALIYVPVLHDLDEMGPLTEYLGDLFEQYTKGKDQWHEKIAHFWELTEEYLRSLDLFDPNVASRLYIFPDSMCYGANQEGLRTFLEEASKGKSFMAKVVLKLHSLGATICGAEDPDIMRSISNVVRKFQKEGGEFDVDFVKSKIEARNLAIIKNIDEIVPDEHIALLLLGVGHNGILEIEELYKKFIVLTPIKEG